MNKHELSADRESGAGQMNQSAPSSPTVARRSKLRAILFLSFSIFLGASVALIALEVGMRLFADVTDVPKWIWDPILGARRAPNQAGRFVRAGGVNAKYSFNRQGWNCPVDYEIAHPAGAARVCVIGDSYVEALQVDAKDSLTLVGQRSMEHAGRSAQWYAFGCSGFGLAQYYLLLHHVVSYYHPDAVVILLVANDVYDSSPYLVSDASPNSTLDVDESGRITLFEARPFEPSAWQRVAYSSALVRYLFAQRGIHRMAGGVRELRRNIFLRDESGGHLLMGAGLSEKERYRLSWQHAERVLTLIRNECNGIGCKLLLAYVGNDPWLRSVYSGEPYKVAPAESDPFCMEDRVWEMGDDWYAPIAKRIGAAYLDLTPPLEQEVRRTRQRHDFGDSGDDHYSALGHRVAGEAIAEQVGRLLNAGGS